MANAGAHESSHSGKNDSQSTNLQQTQLSLTCDALARETHGSDKFFNLDLSHSGGNQSSDGGYADDSGKSSKHDHGSDDSFGRGNDGGDSSKSGHDDHGRGDDGKGNDGGDSSNGGNDSSGGKDWNWGNPGCGNTCGGNGGSNCGDPGSSTATPEPGTSFFSFIAAGVMALLLVRRRTGLDRA